MNQKATRPGARRPSRAIIAALAGLSLVLVLLGLAQSLGSSPTTAVGLFPDGTTPQVATNPDQVPVELGVRFSSTVDGTVTGVRFYKGSRNNGTHVGSLWTGSGTRLGRTTFTDETKSGWQAATFSTPIRITKGRTYVASYLAPSGHYAADAGGFDSPVSNGPLTAPAGGGLYLYGTGGFPVHQYLNSNYYVDVMFQPTGKAPAQTPARPSTQATASPPAPAPSPPTPGTPPTPDTTLLDLPRIPWEGGSAYWKQFRAADAAGWDDPSFFPIVAWYNGVSSDAEAIYDKSLGVNTYIGMAAGTSYRLFKDNDIYWIGGKLDRTFTDASTNWVGDFLDDEVDGRFTPAQGRAHLQALKDAVAGNGRFDYANFTQIVMSTDGSQADHQAYVNNFTDAVSVDMYWYTIPFCDLGTYRGGSYLEPINKANCRTASSYGKTMDMLRKQDAVDGKLQPLWQFVENLNGGPGEGPFVANITGGQLRGAVMNSIINEARGIVYFNQSLSGACQGGSIFRQSQVTPNFCGASQVAAAKVVNNQIHQLAPIINSQSYRHTFGAGLNTMLKAHDGSAYVFAMIDGAGAPGDRTFTLPTGVQGVSVEVLGENRTLPVGSDGTFRDAFANEYSYHIYRVSISGTRLG